MHALGPPHGLIATMNHTVASSASSVSAGARAAAPAGGPLAGHAAQRDDADAGVSVSHGGAGAAAGVRGRPRLAAHNGAGAADARGPRRRDHRGRQTTR